MTLKCMIGGVDVASSLMAFSLPNPGIGRIGAATLTFRRQTGGLTSILPMRDVQIYDFVGGEITKRWFGGLVAIPKRTNTAATVHWEVECQDYNHLLHSINNNAAAANGYTIPLDDFQGQIQSAVTQWQQMGYGAVNTAIDATSQVDNLVGTNIPAHGPYKGVSLGYVIQQICNEAQRINPALRPRFFMGLSEDILGGAPFGPPNLVVYDAAAAIASTYTFSDTPTGAERHIYNFSKVDDAATLVNRRQLMYNENLVTTYEDTTSGTDYPNPYQNHGLASNKGYWTAEPLSGMTFASTAAADAYIERHVKQLAYPLTTIEFDVDVDLTVIPGTVHYIEHSGHSVAGQYRCVGVDVTMSEDMPEVAHVHCIFGARRLELFEDGEEIFEPPVLGSGLPPDPPTSPLKVSNIYDPQLRQAAVRTQVTASVSSDVAGYEIMWSDGFSGGIRNVGLVTDYTVYTRPGSSYSIQWRAYDNDGLHSTWTIALTGTSASREAPRSLLWGDFEGLSVSDATSPEGWTLATSGVATITIDTTTANVYTGKRSLKMVGAAGATCTATSDFISVAAGTWMSWRLPAKGSIAGAFLVGQVAWYDAAEALLSTSTITAVGGDTVSTSYSVFSTGVMVPASAALAKFIVTNDGAPVGTLWVDGLQFFPASVDSDIAAGAVDGTHLASVLDYDGVLNITSTASVITAAVDDALTGEAPAAIQLQHTLSSGSPGVGTGVAIDFQAETSTNVTESIGLVEGRWTDPDYFTREGEIRIRTYAAASSWLERLRLARRFVRTGNATEAVSFVVGTAAITTGQTDGFVYLPSMAGKPTGTPTTYTGTFPVVWDSTNNTLWIYKGGAWRVLTSEGTAFPASPYTGQKFYRSDEGVECYYDGTRWLGPPVTQSLYGSQNSGGVAGAYTATTLIGRWSALSAHVWKPISVTWAGKVATTNNALNYWTLRFGTENAGGGGSVESDVTTAGFTADQNQAISGTTFANTVYDFSTSSTFDVFLEVRKDTGAPGTLHLVGANMIWRRVYS